MKKTLLATALTLAFGLNAAWAQSHHHGIDVNLDVGIAAALGDGNAAATNGGRSSIDYTNSFNQYKMINEQKLKSEVSKNDVSDIGNQAKVIDSGNSRGGKGGFAVGLGVDVGVGHGRNVGTGGGARASANGGEGGEAGSVRVDTGTFAMSNSLKDVGGHAAGVYNIGQQTGINNSMQTASNVSVQMNGNLGSGR